MRFVLQGSAWLALAGLALLTPRTLAPLCAQTMPPAAKTKSRPKPQTDVSALAAQALAAREEGRLRDSIGLYRKLLALRPSHPEYSWYQGLNYYDTDQYKPAAQAFRRLTQLDKENGPAWAFLGLCEFQNRDYPTAFAALVFGKRFGLPRDSELDRVTHHHYLMLANKIGQFELAAGLLGQLSHTHPNSPLLVEMAGLSALRLSLLPSEIPPDLAEPVNLAGRASVLAWNNRAAEAKDIAQLLLARHSQRPNTNYLMGFVLSLNHDPASLDYFKKELEVSPDHVQARLQIANAYLQSGEAGEGLPFAEQAVRLAPDEFIAQDFYGRILTELNRLPEAIRHLELALKLAPTSPEVHFHLATAYARAGRSEDAEKHRKIFVSLQKARQSAPPATFPDRRQ
jgi:tetratricopeptide (TPR) repeat protein